MRVLRLSVRSGDESVQVRLSTAEGKPLREGTVSSTTPELLPPAIFGELARLCRAEPTALHIDADLANSDADWESLEDTCGARVVVRGRGIAARLPRRNLRVLVCWSDPSSGDYPPLQHLEAEVDAVCNGLRAPECRKISIKELPHATSTSIERRIRAWKPHVIHFVGHCQSSVPSSYLVTEDGKGGCDKLFARELATITALAGTRLLVLSGCHTASTAMLVADEGVTTAIGIRDRLGDQYAYAWSRAFYAALGAGATFDEAVAQTRLAVSSYGAENRPVLVIANGADDADERPPPPTNLPTFLRPFVGRMRQRSEIAERLLKSRVRLLTLHAMGGMGKTRLACQVGWDVLQHYEDGIWFIDCDFLSTGDQLVASVCEAVGAPPGIGLRGLSDFLAESQLLLVIDCFERFVDEYRTLTTILSRCPDVQILVTSRIVLDEGQTYPLLPLADGGESKGTEALQLFESLAAERTGLVVTRETRSLCKQIVRRLQGVPLALVLAAGRLQHVSLAELHDRLCAQTLGDTRKSRSNRDKHASLFRVVSDSFDLLPDEGRKLGVAISVFQGSFTMQDACAVIRDYDDVEHGIYLLCDHAVLSATGIGVSTRYRALDTVREYLAALSESVDWPTLRLRHFEHFSKSAESLRIAISSPPSNAAGTFLQGLGNYRSVWQYALSTNEDALILATAASLSRLFFEVGLRTEFLEIAEHGTSLARAQGDRARLSEFLGLLGSQAGRDGHFAAAETFWREKKELCRKQMDGEMLREISLDLALMYSRNNQPERSLAIIEELWDELSLIPDAHALRGQILAELGELTEAARMCESAERSLKSAKPLSPLFTDMTLSSAYLALKVGKSCERHAKKMLDCAVRLHLDQPAGLALLILAKCYMSVDRTDEGVRFAHGAACMPKSASHRVWNESRELLKKMQQVVPTKTELRKWPQVAMSLSELPPVL